MSSSAQNPKSCHLEQARRIPRSGRLRARRKIPRICPLRCGSEVFSPICLCYASPRSRCLPLQVLGYILSIQPGMLDVGATGRGWCGDSPWVELAESAWKNKHSRDLSTRRHPGKPGLGLAQDDRVGALSHQTETLLGNTWKHVQLTSPFATEYPSFEVLAMKLRSAGVVLSLTLWSLTAVADDMHHHDLGEKLGTVSFPISCAPAVQKPFERGLALLYSFEYEEDDNQFKAVAAKDAKCAMAYWGQAMSLYHQLWARPGKEDLKRGADLLGRAKGLKPATGREREYIDALTVFYSNTDKLDHRQRADGYAAAMAGVYQHNPQDREAGVLYALALLASGPERDPSQANAGKAVAILNKLFDEQPDHPGIAHYIIHACDNPSMAGIGLAAARKYAAIAPSSPHAVHMPSHIFARLGLWQDDIHSNLAAIAVADKMQMHTMHHRMHSMDFLNYAYLQIGDDQNAKAQIDRLATVHKQDVEQDYRDYYGNMMASFAARYAIEQRQWN